jgi:putative transposase
MSYIKIMVHSVWGTHDHQQLLIPGVKENLIAHIRENARSKKIYIDCINGYSDHIHCLISLGADQNIGKIMQLIKVEASFWANKEKLSKHKIEWAEDYFAGSVSISSINKVRNYINNQEEHHRKITFREEYESFMKSHGFNLG